MAHMDMDMGGGIHGMDGMHDMDGTVEMDGMDHDMHGTDMSSGMDMHGTHGGMDMMGGMHGMHMMGNSSMHMMMMVRQPLALIARRDSKYSRTHITVCLCATCYRTPTRKDMHVVRMYFAVLQSLHNVSGLQSGTTHGSN